nr:hypothetical protein [Lentzea atacamensis]
MPVWVKVPFQPLETVVPAARVNMTDHGLAALVAVLVKVSAPWKPSCQELSSFHAALHPPVGGMR